LRFGGGEIRHRRRGGGRVGDEGQTKKDLCSSDLGRKRNKGLIYWERSLGGPKKRNTCGSEKPIAIKRKKDRKGGSLLTQKVGGGS